jgi:cobalt/nickel transport system permease protein
MLNLALVLTATTAPGHLPKAAQSLHVPGFLIQLTAVTYRYSHLIAQEFGRLRTALRVRGYRSGTNLHSYRVAGRVLGTLLVRRAERGERVGQAMRARGFDGRCRTLSAFRTAARDVTLFVVMVGCVAGLLAWQWGLS